MGIARKIFDEMSVRDAVSWNSIISGFLQNGEHGKAMAVFSEMGRSGVKFDRTTFAVALKASAGLGDCYVGVQLHGLAIRLGLVNDVFTGSALLDMYGKCNRVDDSLTVFREIPEKNWVSWSAMIAACTQNNRLFMGLELFNEMQNTGGVGVSQSIYATIFRSCAGLSASDLGAQFHCHAIKTDFGSDVIVGTATLDMYAKSGSIGDAHKLFNSMRKHNLQSYNAIIVGYARCGEGSEAMLLFRHLMKSNLGFDEITLSGAFCGCASIKEKFLGLQLHALTIKTVFYTNVCVVNAMIDMYGKCGALVEATSVFNEMMYRYCKCGAMKEAEKIHERSDPQPMVSWNAIISGFSLLQQSEDAQRFFLYMLEAGVKPDNFTYAAILDTCANLATVGLGMQIHAQVIKQQLQSDVYISSTLVDMYSKCGKLQDSELMYEKAPKKDLVAWNSLICGYSQHGLGEKALIVFEEKRPEKVNPNRATFLSVLRACAHKGLLGTGMSYFHTMQKEHRLEPEIEHYSCMVDLLGRSGKTEEALRLIEGMPFEADAIIWRTLLSICKMDGNVEIAEKAASCILQLEPDDSSAYILLCNIYADAGMWGKVSEARKRMKANRLKKEPGCSWIEIRDEVHRFVSGDQSHLRCDNIYENLSLLVDEMKWTGDMSFEFHL
ncbi:unnamed protein product [Linum tenue]|uniref:Pentatricopeptide repeat-containing protein n=1 Tax=Linum tenue TaxID=586396 RepID=A0AAV0N703_9ROSI|nr:unnamed protein product [Linum tenue]